METNNDVLMEINNKTPRRRRSETPGATNKLKEEITSFSQTPRRSGRRSIKPIQDYEEIITRSATRKKTFKDNATIYEETEDIVEESNELNDHEHQLVAGQQTPSQRWSISEVGKGSQKRSRRGSYRKHTNSTIKRKIVHQEENEEENEVDEEKQLKNEEEKIQDNQVVEVATESNSNENKEILTLVSEKTNETFIGIDLNDNNNKINGNEDKSNETLDKQEANDEDNKNVSKDFNNLNDINESDQIIQNMDEIYNQQFIADEIIVKDLLGKNDTTFNEIEQKDEIEENEMEAKDKCNEEAIVVIDINTPEYFRAKSRRRRASNLPILEDIDITTPQINYKNFKNSKHLQQISNSFDNDHELEVLNEDSKVLEIFDEDKLNSDEIVNDNHQEKDGEKVVLLQNVDNNNLDESFDDMASLVLCVSEEEDDDQEKENKQRLETKIINVKKQEGEQPEQKQKLVIEISTDEQNVVSNKISNCVEGDHCVAKVITTDEIEVEQSVMVATEKTIIDSNSEEIIAKEDNLNSTFTLEEDSLKPSPNSASQSPEKENRYSKKTETKSGRKVIVMTPYQCITPKSARKPIRVPTPYRTKVRDIDDLEQIQFLSSTKHIGLTTLQPNEIMRSMRKRSFSVCIDGQGAGGKIVKNVSFHSPANETTVIEQFDRIVEENIKNQSVTIEAIETVAKKEIDTNLKRNMFSCDDLSKVGVEITHQKSTDTPNKSKNNTISKPWKFIATKLPNFASIHEKRFGKMENLVDYVARKQERSKNLLNSASKRNATSSSKPPVEKELNNKEKKSKVARKINLVDNNINNRQTKQSDKMEKNKPPVIKKGTKDITANSGRATRNNNKQAIKSGQQILGPDRSVKTTHYVFSSSLKATSKTTTPSSTKAASIAPAQQKQSQQTNANTMTPTGRGVQQQDKIVSRLQRHMDLFKGRSNNHTANTSVRNHTDIIRGVRSNRRFDLQMQHRRNLQN